MKKNLSSASLEEVQSRLKSLGVLENDLAESFIHSSGKGGQNVNKVSTAVRLFHKRSGMEVKCMEGRSQFLNRIRAREILADRLQKKREQERLRIRAELEKKRRLKAGRPKAVKREILRNKRMKAEKKRARAWQSTGEE